MHVRAPGEEESALKEDSGMRDDDGLSLQLTQIMTVWERREDFPEVAVPPDSLSLYLSVSLSFSPSL
jgi:hypothetical protein